LVGTGDVFYIIRSGFGMLGAKYIFVSSLCGLDKGSLIIFVCESVCLSWIKVFV